MLTMMSLLWMVLLPWLLLMILVMMTVMLLQKIVADHDDVIAVDGIVASPVFDDDGDTGTEDWC